MYLYNQISNIRRKQPLRYLILGMLLGPIALSSSLALAQDCTLYRYQAQVTKVYDADTITADIDLGFHTWRLNEKLRLYGINAPEIRSNANKKITSEEKQRGLAARDALRNRILNKPITLCTIKANNKRREDKRGKYGRYLAKIYIDGENINDWLVAKGFAEYHDY